MTNRLMALRTVGALLAILVASLLISAGCKTSTQPDQALEQQNEKLQKKLEAQEQQQQKEKRAEEKKQEEAQQADLEKQVNDLQKQVNNQKQNNQQSDNQASDSSSVSPDVVIENSGVAPSQAPEGVVTVTPQYNVGAASADEAAATNAAIDYYQYVESGDYLSTYNLLSYEDQNYYSQDQWITANTNLDSAAAEFVVSDAFPEDVGNGYITYAVMVSVYLLDGSSFERKTYFTYEDQVYRHWLSTEEVLLLNDSL
jgi:flagellar biosynthesis GTPase FlhF